MITLDDVKSWLKIDPGVTTHDAILEIIIPATVKAVLNYTEATFSTKIRTNELLDGNQSDQILVRETPIQSVQNVYYHVNSDGSGGHRLDEESYYLPEDLDEYEVFDGTGNKGSSAILLRGRMTPRGRGLIRVDYTFGYDSVPPDVKMAALMAVEAEFRRKGRKTLGGVASRSKKDESTAVREARTAWDDKTGLPIEVVNKLKPYRVYEFPTQPMATRNY